MGAYGSPDLSVQDNGKDLRRCKRCGEYFYKGWKRCPNCGKSVGGGAEGCLVAILIVVGIFMFMATLIGMISGGSGDTSTVEDNIKIEEPEISKEEYIGKCSIYDYEEISRYPDNYKGKYAKFSGEVFQVLYDEKYVDIILNMGYNEKIKDYQTVHVSYTKEDEKEARILENDKITVYGQLDGIYKYESVRGDEISIPLVEVKYITLN